MSTFKPKVVPLHGMTMISESPVANPRQQAEFFKSLPKDLIAARHRAAAPENVESFDNTPDFAPQATPAPRF